MTITAVQVANILLRARLNLSVEKATQADIETLLNAALPFGTSIEREARLGPGDIVDFLIDGRIALEVKLKRGESKMKIYGQLQRYAERPAVSDIILATNLTMGLPATIEGKPAYYVSLGRAYL